jgi:hypothetical protein
MEKMLNSQHHLLWTGVPKCPKCQEQYVTYGKCDQRRPMILQCNHTICDACLKKATREIECPTCAKVYKVPTP